ncbi:uncharacterized protein LOC116167449 [Photinus pyralis]|uniref:uncharacterized protein LOC116167449 n=1 Tax=Photinus pyralis TaxID=7054 RepID=UPI0012670E71|nr:uncharacterized protein LOC116167449 [Photinus pyralis]
MLLSPLYLALSRAVDCRTASSVIVEPISSEPKANRLLRECIHFLNENQDTLVTAAASLSIEWTFNPAYAPHFGGLHEACVHSAKKLLVRQVGDTILTIEEFSTLLHRIEAVLNSRPLIAPSNDPIDGVDYLTPGHFLIGTALTSLPEPPSDNSMSSPTRWRLVQQMSYNFWEQWSKDYLNTLMQRNKWKRPQPNLTVGQLVYVRNLNTSPLTWPVGLITALHPGTDGVIRVVDVKIGGKNFTRAVTTLVPLP